MLRMTFNENEFKYNAEQFQSVERDLRIHRHLGIIKKILKWKSNPS